jgi:hypothetical protein
MWRAEYRAEVINQNGRVRGCACANRENLAARVHEECTPRPVLYRGSGDQAIKQTLK